LETDAYKPGPGPKKTLIKIPYTREDRSSGKDWPVHGLTMVGLSRLQNVQDLLESVIKDQVPGTL
jgi:8-demethyl-8-(2,3-dimethoxy-alpha-L-rhamnosyl)tetracenomycin-C 4'-O-methyltransferase